VPAVEREILREISRLLFPWGALIVVLAAAAMLYGSDRDSASLTFSAIILTLAGIAHLFGRTDVTVGAVLGGLALAAFAVGTLLAGRFDTAASEYASLAGAGAVWMIARSGALKTERAALLWQGTLLAGGLIAGYHFFDFVLSPTTLYGELLPYGSTRLGGPFLSANTAATFYGVTALMALAQLVRELSPLGAVIARTGALAAVERAWVTMIVFAVSATCLLLSGSRAGVALFAFSALTFLVWELWVSRKDSLARSWMRGIGAVVISLMVGAILIALSGDMVLSRVSGLGPSSEVRYALMSAYWAAIPLAPWFGHGLGGFYSANLLIADALNARHLLHVGAAHNVYLQWLLQGGIVGTGLMAAVLIAQLRSILSGLSARRRQRSYLRAVICIAIFVFLHGWVDYALEIPGFMWWFAWVLGLGCGIAAAGSGRSKA
jgi:O-antigen ligase